MVTMGGLFRSVCPEVGGTLLDETLHERKPFVRKTYRFNIIP
jgi:hypothetical protein